MTPSTIARLYFAIGFLFGSFFMYIVGQVKAWKRERKKVKAWNRERKKAAIERAIEQYGKEQSTNDGR